MCNPLKKQNYEKIDHIMGCADDDCHFVRKGHARDGNFRDTDDIDGNYKFG